MVMEYRIFRLIFSGGAHIGDGTLDGRGMQLRADTIFSALCIEAIKMGGEILLSRLVSFAQDGMLLLSDSFPFTHDEYYLPKPIFRVQSYQEDVDSAAKKVFKKLKYIPLSMIDDYLSGKFDTATAADIAARLDEKLGRSSIVARAAVRQPEDTLPYHVGVFTFSKDAGLYIIAGGNDETLPVLRELLASLAYAGIGGKRSSGLGRFSVEEKLAPDDIAIRINGNFPAYMTLSVSLPGEDEIGRTLENASYALVRRSGFVFSETYADEPLRKNDLYVLDSGSVVRQRFEGGIYDVSNKGSHPVYRYAKPLFLGVTL